MFDIEAPGISATLLAFASPVVIPVVNELGMHDFFPVSQLLGVLLHFLIYAGILAAFRRQCLTGAEGYLRG
jgi:cytosine/uracil/thiamine/allantoin permease